MKIKAAVVDTKKVFPDETWFYGNEHMLQISKGEAKKLCRMYPLPEVGYETVVASVVAFKQGILIGSLRLCVKNVSGSYMIASSQVRVSDWDSVFGVHIVM